MRSFADRAWSPLGSRPHVFIVLPELASLADAYLTQIARWWDAAHPNDPRPVSQVLRPVPSHFLHLTLAWLDRLSADVDPTQWDQLVDELTDRLRPVPPVTVRFGPATVATCAIEVWVDPDPQLAELARAARAALRAVFGADAAPEPTQPWRPHVALAYASADMDTDTLAGTLGRAESSPGHLIRPQQITITSAVLVDNDTFPADGGTLRWDNTTVRTLHLRAVS